MIVQEITAWRYPCELMFKYSEFQDIYISSWFGLQKYKKELISQGTCRCGKNCKPQKIKITVESCT